MVFLRETLSKKDTMSASQVELRIAAAYLLGAALSDRLGTRVSILECSPCEYGYRVVFSSRDELTDEILIPIAERMWELIREKTPFEGREMMRSNVKELLKFQGKRARLEGHPKELIPVLFFSSLIWPEGESALEHAGEVGSIALTRFEKGDGVFTIGGIRADDSGSLKEAKKAYGLALEADHRKKGKSFFEKEVWTPKGVKLFRKLERYVETLYAKAGLSEVRCPEGMEGNYGIGVWKRFKGDPGYQWGQGLYDAEEGSLTACWSKKGIDLGVVDFPLPLKRGKNSIECPDCYGNFWEIARLEKGGKGSLALCLERLFALLIEHDEIEWLENLEIL